MVAYKHDEIEWRPEGTGYYEESSEDIHATIMRSGPSKGNSSGKHDHGSYLPSPDEIRRRGADLLWLNDQGFSKEFINAVMLHGDPSIHSVVHAVVNKGMTTTQVEALMTPEKTNGRARIRKAKKSSGGNGKKSQSNGSGHRVAARKAGKGVRVQKRRRGSK